VPYRDLLEDVQSTVVNLLTWFRYMTPDIHSGTDHIDDDGDGAVNCPCPDLVPPSDVTDTAAVTAVRSSTCKSGASDVRVGSTGSQDSEHLYKNKGRSRNISSALVHLLRKEKQRKGEEVK
jgi:hypothetical protein